MKDDCIVVKLINGDLFMAKMLNEGQDFILVEDPISVRTIPVTTDGGSIEKTVTNPYCTMTQEREFSFERSHVVFVKPLHPTVVGYYLKLVDTFNEEFAGLDERINLGIQDLEENGYYEPEEDLDEDDYPDDRFIIIPDKNQIH